MQSVTSLRHIQYSRLEKCNLVQRLGWTLMLWDTQFGHIIVEDVYYISTLYHKPLSVSQLDRQELYKTFAGNKVTIRTSPTGNIVAAGPQIVEFYKLVDGSDNSKAYTSDALATVYVTKSSTTALWHRHLAHLHPGAVITLAHSSTIGIPVMLNHNRYVQCLPCLQSEMKRLPFWAENRHTTRPLQLLHIDRFGQPLTEFISRSYCCLLITDDFVKKRDAKCISQKNKLMQRFQQWKAPAKEHLHGYGGQLVEAVCWYQRGEGASKAFEKWFEEEGIVSEYTASYTSQQDEISEWSIQTIIPRGNTIMQSKNLPKCCWA